MNAIRAFQPMELTMLDDAIISHLDAWLERELASQPWDYVLELRSDMIRLAGENADWLDRGWWKLHDHIINVVQS